MKNKIILLSTLILVLFFSSNDVFATSEPILITISPSMEEVIFDGKWTFFSEWKQSSYNVFSFDDRSFNTYVRTAHLGEHIYVFIDPIHDLTLDNKNDQAMICIDGKNEKILLQMKMIFVLLQF